MARTSETFWLKFFFVDCGSTSSALGPHDSRASKRRDSSLDTATTCLSPVSELVPRVADRLDSLVA